MKLLLDVHISDKRVGEPLRADGHDVIATQADEGLKRLYDGPLLDWAWPHRRIIVSVNAKDFIPITGEWMKLGKRHAGCILIPPGVGSSGHSTIIAGIADLLTGTGQEDWFDVITYIPS